MISKDDVKKLATLSRVAVSDDELEKARQDLDSIISYVSQVSEALVTSEIQKTYDNTNVFRDDINPHESGIHTETLLASAPSREGNYLKVKNIL